MSADSLLSVTPGPPRTIVLQPADRPLVRELLDRSLVHPHDWLGLSDGIRDEVEKVHDPQRLLRRLVELNLLTPYQADRVQAGTGAGLTLGNYRILDRIGAGGMAVVFKAEHRLMRRPVAVKVLPPSGDMGSILLPRFFAEIQALGRLQHPNIAAALDAGQGDDLHAKAGPLYYLVMEFVPGQDLEELVAANGPLPVAQACELIHQSADALAEAHRRDLVHRDVKPSNIRVTPDGQAKLLDFGLARQWDRRMTQAGTILGTPEYMAPEQAQDASTVDGRTDVYGLGGTLFWCLTGRPPFPPKESLVASLLQRVHEKPPAVREYRPDVPAGLEAVIQKMLATQPDDRYPNMQAVTRAVLPFIRPEQQRVESVLSGTIGMPVHRTPRLAPESVRPPKVLIVDDEPLIRQSCGFALKMDGLTFGEAPDGPRALQALQTTPYELVLLDIDMPGMNGADVCQRIRSEAAHAHLKVIMMSGRATADEMSKLLTLGADDYLSKPLSVVQLQARVKAALRLRDAQVRSDRLNDHLVAVNAELERTVTLRDGDLVQARNALVLALAKLAGHRDHETGSHLLRLQRYVRCLAEELTGVPALSRRLTPEFVETVVAAAPLHDIGKVGIPDCILLKPGRLDPDERLVMESHTVIGHDTLQAVAEQNGFALTLLNTAAVIARSHHERWDGSGYPDGLAGEEIPLAARLVAVGDVYDALRSRRPYKPPLSHAIAVQTMMECSPGHFDPTLLETFHRRHQRFEQLFRQAGD